ncbi:MAG: tRNA (adenosine(37)-N6)-threonylcarbamoyltransferase complex ATPase subunit type 1 TsaE [Candidatus Daviesbacteria bacterium]|nr:tRNA (adenosine(37)-N6)-threonylcarbamoyltransferase complex ATPase subunit type 1 TsaE [Candidatus Daviesbacteria bacterium]
MKNYISHSENETKKIAEEFAKKTKGHIFALTGELGAGKTIFVQGFAKGLGVKDKIISPTFVLIRQHQIPKSSKTLYHIDLYRLENTESLKHLGLEEILSDPNNTILIEWAEKIEKFLPKNTIKIKITKEELYSRLISTSITPNFSADKRSINL